jgi:TPP-dependent indolepyruvate ferredoxin oxidoreductase alpha subunit
MNFYAQPRMTRDIDLVIALEPRDAQTIVALFQTDYYLSPEAIQQAIARQSVFNLIHLRSVIKVDGLVRKQTEYRELEFSRRQPIQIQGFSAWIVTKEDLILSKLHWARDSHSELQLRDVKNLAASGCDRSYVESWARRLGLEGLWKECVHD